MEIMEKLEYLIKKDFKELYPDYSDY
jgi:hypothetical protein